MSQDSLKPVYDDQVNEEAYKRGSQYKWTKARKADYERDGSHDQAPPDKKVYVCGVQSNTFQKPFLTFTI